MDTRYLFGSWQDGSKPLTVADVESLIVVAEKRRKQFSGYPLERILRLCERVGNLWPIPPMVREKPWRRSCQV